jgi:hypothetical protein
MLLSHEGAVIRLHLMQRKNTSPGDVQLCTMYISNGREGPSVVSRNLQNEVWCAKPDLEAYGWNGEVAGDTDSEAPPSAVSLCR